MIIQRVLADWRLLAALVALAAVGAGLALFVQNLIAAAIPLLIVAACPLSMVVMMRMMGSHESSPGLGPKPSSGDQESLLRDRLAATRREQLHLEEELARVEDEHRAAAAKAPEPAPAADARARG